MMERPDAADEYQSVECLASQRQSEATVTRIASDIPRVQLSKIRCLAPGGNPNISSPAEAIRASWPDREVHRRQAHAWSAIRQTRHSLPFYCADERPVSAEFVKARLARSNDCGKNTNRIFLLAVVRKRLLILFGPRSPKHVACDRNGSNIFSF
jgi:hypothetical protein